MGFPGANFPLHTFSKGSHSLLLLWLEMPSTYWQPWIYIFHPDFAPSLTHTLKQWLDICLQVLNSQPPQWPCVWTLSLTLGWTREWLWPTVYKKEVASTCLGVLSTLELPCEKSNYPPGGTTWSDLTPHGKGERPSHPHASAELRIHSPSKIPDMWLKPSWTPIPSCQMMGATGGTPIRPATKEPSSSPQSIHRTVAVLCQ